MPNINSAAKSVSGIVLEATNSGQYALLTDTLVSALPVSLTTSIPASAATGMRIIIGVRNHTASGTLTIAGTSVGAGAALTETTGTIPVAANPGDVVYYTTTTVYGAVNASGVTLGSGLTGGTILLWGVQAAKRMLVGEVKVMDKRKDHFMMAQRGTVDEVYYQRPLSEDPELEFTADYYPDDNLFLLNAGLSNSVTATSIPATGVAILGATSVVSLSTGIAAALQPTTPGMVLQCVLSGTLATAATVTVTGTNITGETISEVIVPSTKATGTYTSSNVFVSIASTGIAYGAFGGTASLLINAYYGWSITPTAGPSFNLATLALENYDSTGSFVAPYWVMNEISIEGKADGELKVMAKGPCQSVYPVGDPTVNTNQVTTFAQTYDEAITGWSAIAFIDNTGTAAGTTLQADLIDFKIVIKLNAVPKHTSWSTAPVRKWNRVYLKKRRVDVDMTLDLTNSTLNAEYVQGFKQDRKRLVQIQIRGPFIGTVSGVNYYLGSTWTFPIKWTAEPVREYTSENPVLKLKGVAYVDPSLGYSHNAIWYTRLPNY